MAADPLLAAQVQAIINNPVAAQRPDLVHFAPPAIGSTDEPPDGASADEGSTDARTHAGQPVVPAVPGGAAALLFLSVALCRRRRLGRRATLRLLAASLLSATASFGVALMAGGDAAPVRPASAPGAETVDITTPVASPGMPRSLPAAHSRGATQAALRMHAVSPPMGAGNGTWSSLVSIETAVTSEHERLLSDEQHIATITQQLSDRGHAAPPPQTLRPGYAGVLRTALQQTADDHQEAATSYNASLQSEYSFYVGAAQSAEEAAELTSMMAHTSPDVEHAVITDLTLVQTQLQQEAQVAAAEATAAATQRAAADVSETPPHGPVTAEQLIRETALRFHPPASGVVTQPFGPTQFAMEPPLTYGGVFYPHFHTGLDIAAPLDTPVSAAADGTVLLATSSVDAEGHLTGYGNYVVIGHGDGFVTLYGHLDRLLVTPGQAVQQGQVIGLMGSTGWSTGPHVHFEIRSDGVYVDPAPFLAAQPQS